MTDVKQTEQKENVAKTLLEKMGVRLKNSVEIEIAEGEVLRFMLDTAAYDAFLNDLKEDNKITPAKDYLLAIVDPACKATLLEIIHLPNMALQLVGIINEELIPKVEFKVKKSPAVLKA